MVECGHMNSDNALIYALLYLPWLGLFVGALLPVCLMAKRKRLALWLRVTGFLLFAPAMWVWSCIVLGAFRRAPSLWEMFVSAVLTTLFYLSAVAVMAFLRWAVQELVLHYTSTPRK